jgi:CRP-like cAMP-binding protein
MKESKHNCDLKSCFLCKRCLKEWLPAIDANRKNFVVKKGEVIFNEGEPVTGIYFVYTGKVKVHKKWGSEKELIVRIAQSGAILGHRGLGDQTIYPVSATALEAGVVCYIDMEFFKTTLKVNNNFTTDLVMFFASELQISERKMRNLAHMPVKGRVAQSLITFKQQFGVTPQGFIDIELTRQDLASYTGATYETVFRTINELIAEQLITASGKRIAIVNETLLQKLTQEDNF